MTAQQTYAASLQQFATMCGVSVANAELFVGLVSTGVNAGMTLENAIARGRNALMTTLTNIQRNPRAARQLVPDLYETLRAKQALRVAA
jgi:hypothetical protein